MQQHYDVIIVGGGVSGSATAYFLAANPDFDGTVAVVERDPSYAFAPSAKATGGIRQQFSTPENIRIGLFGAEFVKQADALLGVDGEPTGLLFREQGYLMLGTEAQLATLEANNKVQRAEGAQIVLKTADALAAQFPWLNVDGLAGALFGERNEGWVDPYTLLQSFRRKARSLGVSFLTDEVTALHTSGDRVTQVSLASGGQVAAGAVVNAAGASGARALVAPLGIDLPIESRQRVTFVFECREDLGSAPLTILPTGLAWRPEGTRFLANLAPPAERDPERFDYEIDHAQFENDMWPALAHRVPAFEAIKVVQAYCCHYDFNTLDENAIIGALPGFANLHIAIGFSGHGMQQSPAVGRALSELITYGEYRALDLSRLGFERVLTGQLVHESNCW